jgi:site-specific DNA recombinase
MMNIAIYARVSTQSQAKEGTINSQLEALRKYAQDQKLTITHECIDNGISGSTLEREGLDELRDLALAGEVSGVLALSPDRLSRRQFDQMVLMEEFKKHNIKIFFTNQQFEDTPAGNFMLQVQGAMSEYERANIRDRMRRGQRHAVKKGQVIAGNTPFGYTLIRKTETSIARWEVNEAEAEIVRLIFDLYIKQGMKGTEIVRYLNDKGTPTRKAAQWWSTVVYSILKNESYLGTAYMYKTKRVTPIKTPKTSQKSKGKLLTSAEDRIGVPVPQLIERETWEAAQELLKKNAYRSRRNNNVNKYLLRGLIVCGECGSMCPGYVSNKKTYYSCGAKRNKNITTKPHDDVNITARQKPFDEKIWQGLTELLETPENLQTQIEKRLPQTSKFSKAAKDTQSKIEKKLEKLAIQEKRILDAYREEIIELDELREQKAKIAEERTILHTQQKAAQSQLEHSGRPEITMATLGDISARFERAMAKADFSTREKLTNLLVKSVALHKTKAVVKGYIPMTTTDVLIKPRFVEPLFYLR